MEKEQRAICAPNQETSPQRMRQFSFTHALSVQFTAHAV
jgi:hypothetical protein